MKYAVLDIDTYALRLEPGDDIHDSIQQFCNEQQVSNASVQGIGSVDSPTVAHYSVSTKQFTDKHLEGIYEVTSLLGNVGLVENKPFTHIHITVADNQMQVHGGHLVQGKCSATLELIVVRYSSAHSKTQDDKIGLKVWDFKD